MLEFPLLGEMLVQSRAMRILVPLTPSAQSCSTAVPSIGKQHGQEA